MSELRGLPSCRPNLRRSAAIACYALDGFARLRWKPPAAELGSASAIAERADRAGAGSCAKASRAGFSTGAAATAVGGTIVGWLVSNTTASGHLCRDWMRMMERSTSVRPGFDRCLRHVPIGEEEQGKKEASGESEISTERHQRIPVSSFASIKREEMAMVPRAGAIRKQENPAGARGTDGIRLGCRFICRTRIAASPDGRRSDQSGKNGNLTGTVRRLSALSGNGSVTHGQRRFGKTRL